MLNEIAELKEALRKAIVTKKRLVYTLDEYNPTGSTYKVEWTNEAKAWAKLCDLNLNQYDPCMTWGKV